MMKGPNKRKISLIIIMGLLMSGLVACGNKAAQSQNIQTNPTLILTGRWMCEETYAPDGFPFNFELFSDGSGAEIKKERTINWIAENNRLKLVVDNYFTYLYSYEVNEASLILKDDEGKKVKYIKQE